MTVDVEAVVGVNLNVALIDLYVTKLGIIYVENRFVVVTVMHVVSYILHINFGCIYTENTSIIHF